MSDIPVPCDVCGKPAAYLTETGMRWMSRHDGGTHWTEITPGQLQDMLDARYEWYCRQNGDVTMDIFHNCQPFGRRRPADHIGRGKWRCVQCGAVWDLIPKGEG
jgi:ribosomal protein S14